MGIFDKSSKVEDTRSKERKSSDQYLADLLKQPTPNLPTQQIAGMSDPEKRAQGLVTQYGSTEAEGLAGLREQAGASDDITQDPTIKALMDVLSQRGSDEANRLSRSLTLRGATGGAGEDVLGRGLDDIQSNILATLAPYAESAKNRKLNATQLLGQLGESSTLNRLNALSTTGALPRTLEQMRNTAEYNKLMQEILFPYNEKLAAAGTLTGANSESVYAQGPSAFDKAGAVVGMGADVVKLLG